MTESLPLPITSLLPVVLFPLLGILDTGTVCTAYMKVHMMIPHNQLFNQLLMPCATHF